MYSSADCRRRRCPVIGNSTLRSSRGVFTEDQKHAMVADLTEVIVRHEGSEAFRDVVWVLSRSCTPMAGTSAGSRSGSRSPALRPWMGMSGVWYGQGAWWVGRTGVI